MRETGHLEISSKTEVNGFRKIKPEEGMTVQRARSFWDTLFSKKVDFSVEIDDSSKLESKKGKVDVGDNFSANTGGVEGSGQRTGEIDSSGEAGDEKEKRELTTEEINELQKQAIWDAFKRIARGEKLTDAEKGNLGEMLMDLYYISKGYMPIHKTRVIDLAHKSGQGIDGVYERTNPDGTKSYVVADAKVNYSQLNKGLADGTDQMSDAWINKRLDDAVGKEKADVIRDSYEDNPDSISREVYHFSYGETDDGTSSAEVYTVDEYGNKNADNEMVQVFDSYGNDITGGECNDKG